MYTGKWHDITHVSCLDRCAYAGLQRTIARRGSSEGVVARSYLIEAMMQLCSIKK